ncbi:MAG: peroxidase family protein [Bacteroidota bacterium]
MKRRLLFPLFYLCTFALFAQVQDMVNYRTIDGMYNNLENPNWGSANSDLLQFTDLGFADGYSAMGGASRPNPRVISNTLFSQEGVLNDAIGLSDFVWAWGQFLDHDIGLTTDGPEPLMIQVPAGDPHFDPFGEGNAIIPMHRNAIAPGSGTSITNPRRYVNEITACIDGSAVYGSDLNTAAWLRSFSEGKLKVSTGNRLPYNTTTGEFTDPLDDTAPHMENPTNISEVISVAGDPRAGENPLLESFHTLFVREHNRQCDLILKDHPDWTDEEVYQHARKIVGGLIQSIVYDEWLPALGVDLPSYTGYNDQIVPQLMNVFTAAAFRLGHTMLTSNVLRLDNDGQVIPQGNLTLRNAFFNPFAIQETGGISPFFKGMAVQSQQLFDAKVVDDIRNFLFGPPGAGGLDLASININRGRERGLPDFNTVRENFGLARYNFFQQINSSAAVFTRLLSLYTDIDDIDPWVGFLAERPAAGSVFGPTLREILTRQFLTLRDGDRFYYLIDPVLSQDEKDYITTTSLRDVVMYNTGVDLMQDNVFLSLPHEEICDNMTYSLSGFIRTATGEPLPGVNVELVSAPGNSEELTAAEGTFAFPDMSYCDLQMLFPSKNDDPINGVSTFDIIQIQKHILGTDVFTDPYQLIAADINASGTISTIDLIRLRKLILGIDTDFGENTSWRFVLGAYEFPEGENPLTIAFPEDIDFANTSIADFNSGFVAVKVGDVNNSVDVNGLDAGDDRLLATGLSVRLPEYAVEIGEVIEMEVKIASQEKLNGWQFALGFPGFEVLSVENSTWPSDYYHMTGKDVRLSYHSSEPEVVSGKMTVRVMAYEEGSVSELVGWSRYMAAEAYGTDDKKMAVEIITEIPSEELMVGQNEPNPFSKRTLIPFELSAGDELSLEVYTTDGKTIYRESSDFGPGMHYWELERQRFPAAGLYYYRVEGSTGAQVRTLVVE